MSNWKNIRQIIFDADDTLWENNIYYVQASGDFFKLVCKAGFTCEEIERDFDTLELEVVKEFGYGSKNFVLILERLFEKYNALSNNALDKEQFQKIVKCFTDHPTSKPAMFPKVIETLHLLNEDYNLFVLTKGEHEEQSGKIKRAGIHEIVEKYYVAPEKDDSTYLSLLKENNWKAEETCMVGNSPKSDINPALRCGMFAIHIPYRDTWKLDNEPVKSDNGRFMELEDFASLIKIFK